MNKKQVSITLGIMCLILTTMVCIQLNTFKNTETGEISQTTTESNLRDELLVLTQKYETLSRNLEIAEENLEKERKNATENNESSATLEEHIKTGNELLGLTEVTGQGVVVTLDDNKTASLETIGAFDSIDQYLVHDGDLLQIINELKNAGAEAISVNDQRIVTTSAITCDGNVVRINSEKVGAPYIINAIGLPDKLYGALTRPESYMKRLQRDGVETDIKKSTSITLPKYTGTFSSEYIEQSN